MQERSDPSLAEAFKKCLNAYYPTNNNSQSQGSSTQQVTLESALQEALVLFHAAPDFRELLSTTNEYNQTLAHLSILSGYTTLLNSLVEWGIDLTIADVNGFTALHCAYLMGSEDCIQLLRNRGAPDGAIDNIGRVPQDLCEPYDDNISLNNTGRTGSAITIPTTTNVHSKNLNSSPAPIEKWTANDSRASTSGRGELLGLAMGGFHQNSRMKPVLLPFMLAWLLLQRALGLLSASRRQLVLLRPSATLVRRDVRRSGLILVPSELLFRIVEWLESDRAQAHGSVLALSQ